MGVTPQYVGKYGKPWLIMLDTDSGTDNITGISAGSISIVLRNSGTGTEATSTGTITIASANPAAISWQPTAADYAAAGEFQARTVVTFSAGPVQYDGIPFEIQTA